MEITRLRGDGPRIPIKKQLDSLEVESCGNIWHGMTHGISPTKVGKLYQKKSEGL